MEPTASASSSPSLGSESWERRYQESRTGWDLGQPAPPFVHWLQAPHAPLPGRTVVLGAGLGHDAMLFARHGFDVTAVDFAPSAVTALSEAARIEGVRLTCLQRNIFDLLPEYQGQFDYVVEHTCFCALDPNLRSAYVSLVANLLVPTTGELLALFFTHRRAGGPPFGITPHQLHQLFAPRFDLVMLKPTPDSVLSRQGDEHIGCFRLRSQTDPH